MITLKHSDLLYRGYRIEWTGWRPGFASGGFDCQWCAWAPEPQGKHLITVGHVESKAEVSVASTEKYAALGRLIEMIDNLEKKET